MCTSITYYVYQKNKVQIIESHSSAQNTNGWDTALINIHGMCFVWRMQKLFNRFLSWKCWLTFKLFEEHNMTTKRMSTHTRVVTTWYFIQNSLYFHKSAQFIKRKLFNNTSPLKKWRIADFMMYSMLSMMQVW